MWIPNIESFEEAAALTREQLQIVLDAGRPEQRVWAIWALALRSDGRTGSMAGRAPDAGARRALAVVLAGHGETAALIQLATNDPDVFVRETAMQLVTRLAAGGAIGRDVIEEGLARDPAIRIAALGAIGKGAPQFLISIAHRLLLDSDPEIAGEAFEALLRLDTREGRDAARVWMLRRPKPWTLVFRWLRAGDVYGLAEAASGSPMTVRGRVLEQLRAPAWEAVQLLVGKDLELLWVVLSRDDIAIPSTVLAHAILRNAHAGFAQRLVQQLALAGNGEALLADLRAAMHAAAPDLRGLWRRVRRYADAIEIEDRHAVLDEIADAHPVEQLLGLENAVSRWSAERDAPPELRHVVDELQPHCEQVRERMQLAGHDRPPANPRAQAGRQDSYAAYRDIVDLIAALHRLKAST